MDIFVLLSLIIASFFAIISLTIMVVNIVKVKGFEKLLAIRDYKKWKFIYIYIALFFMNLAAFGYDGGWLVLSDVLETFKQTVEGAVLKFDYNAIKSIYENVVYYRVLFIIIAGLVFLNTVLVAVSLFYIQVWKFVRLSSMKKKEELVVFFGYNANTLKIIKTIDQKKYGCIVINQFNNNYDELLKNNIPFINSNIEEQENINRNLKNIFEKHHYKKCYIIINTESDKYNLIISKELCHLLNNDIDNKIKGYVFGTCENESAFIKYVEASSGKIKYINKQKLVAFDFVDKYPLTKFMTSEHIDYQTGTLKDINVNVFLLGFGNTSKQILLASVANNQFITLKDGVPTTKLVNYYVYNSRDNDGKNMNHYYYRLENDEHYFEGREDEFLSNPKETKPANIIARNKIDVEHKDFYQIFKDDISKTNKKDINYIIISVSQETENIDLAEKIVSKINEWDVDENTYVFVRAIDSSLEEQIEDKDAEDEKELKISETEYCINGIKISGKTKKNVSKKKKYYFFGEEDQIVYNFKNILSEELESIARKRDMIYKIEGMASEKYTKKVTEEVVIPYEEQIGLSEAIRKSWYTKLSQIQRDSNLYAVLSIRSKLQLLGFDVVKNNEKELLNEKKYREVKLKEFYDYYFNKSNAKKKFDFTFTDVNGNEITKTIYHTSLEFPPCIRTYMGMQEHLRWSAYTISMGVIPSTIKEIIETPTNGKDYLICRKHGNITTFEGLLKFDKIVAVKNYIKDQIKEQLLEENKSIDENELTLICQNIFENDFEKCEYIFDQLPEEVKDMYLKNADVIKYDYQLLDDLEALLALCNYRLVRNINLK